MTPQKNYKLLAKDGVEITPQHIGRKVNYQTYEGYGDTTMKGVGTIASIKEDYVTLRMGYSRNIYGRGGFNVGSSDLIEMRGEWSSEDGAYLLHRSRFGFSLDYPTTFNYVFELLDEEPPVKKTGKRKKKTA